MAPLCALAAVAVAALLFVNRPVEPANDSSVAAEPGAAAYQPATRVAPVTPGRGLAPRAPSPTASTRPEAALPLLVSNDVPRVPDAYTGDPEGQALWEKTVDEDQQTLQPDDLIEDPAPPKLDLTKIPAYQAQGIDADGNLN